MKKAMLTKQALIAALGVVGLGATSANADAPSAAIRNRSIGYVMTGVHWATYATEKATECPDGFNDGPREQYSALFPKDGKQRTVAETELTREAAVWFPDTGPEPSTAKEFKFKEPVGTVAPGLNLDGKVGPNDYTSPDGEKGIDNQFNRVYGCVSDMRPGGSLYFLWNKYLTRYFYPHTVIEITNVDDLVNDDDVTVTFYRGLDAVLADAGGTEFLPYATQRVDERWGKLFKRPAHGKIVNGVLTSDPGEINRPYIFGFEDRTFYRFRDGRVKLNLTPESAKGVIAGYLDVKSWYRAINGALGTHSLSYGQESSPSLYRALFRLADAYPDANGKNTAISAVEEVTFKQVYVQHDEPKTASDVRKSSQANAR